MALDEPYEAQQIGQCMQLTRRGSFLTAALVAGISLWASGAPTMIYPQYADAWGLTTQTTTALFAVYPIALVPTLVIFGNLSDAIGRRAVILLGLAALALGSLAFALAPNLGWVFAGRTLMGIGVGLSLSPATAAILENARRPSAAAATTTAATAGGLVLATTVSGALVQYAPDPLHRSYWVLVAATALTFALAWFLPRQNASEPAAHWRPRVPMIPSARKTTFAAGALAIGAAYSMGAIFLALGAHITRDLLHTGNTVIDGALIAVSALAIGAVAFAARGVSAVAALRYGPFLALLGLAALILAGSFGSLALFLISSLIGGAGYSLLFAGGLGLVSASAPAAHRAMVMSAAYVIAYVLQAATALGLGALTRGLGLQPALLVGAPLVVAVGFIALALSRRPAPTSLSPLVPTLERNPS